MPRSALRIRARVRVRPTLARRALHLLWKIVRIVMTIAAAMGPGMPPPPPPPRPTANLEVAAGGAREEEE